MTRIVLTLLALALGLAAAAAECFRPMPLQFEVTDKIVRSEVGFTQGLEWREGKLYESTGAVGGRSGLNVIASDGTVTNLINHGSRVFGEGLTILNNELFQLTWTDRVVHVFDLTGKLKRTMHNPRDGWGLTNDSKQLIFSDGGPSFYFADPQTFTVTRTVKIRSDTANEMRGLNELEWVDGKLYGNIYRTQTIVRIDVESGCIEAIADMGPLWRSLSDLDARQVNMEGNVLNGIAYSNVSGTFYVTGKRWPMIFTGRFIETK